MQQLNFKVGNTTFLLDRAPDGSLSIYRGANNEELAISVRACEVRDLVDNLAKFTGYVSHPSEHTNLASQAWITEVANDMSYYGEGPHEPDVIRWLCEMEAAHPDFHLSNLLTSDIARLLWHVKSTPRFSDGDPDGAQGLAGLVDEFDKIFGGDWAVDCLEVALENIPCNPV